MLAVTPGLPRPSYSSFLTVQTHADQALSQRGPAYNRAVNRATSTGAALLGGRVTLGSYQSLKQAALAQQLPSPATVSAVQVKSSCEGQVRTASPESLVSYK